MLIASSHIKKWKKKIMHHHHNVASKNMLLELCVHDWINSQKIIRPKLEDED